MDLCPFAFSPHEAGIVPGVGYHFIGLSLFCAERPDRIIICIPVQSLQPPPGRPYRTHIQLSNYDCESEGDRRSPRVEGRGLAVFSGAGAQASHMGAWGRIAPTKCIRFINPAHTLEKSLFIEIGIRRNNPGQSESVSPERINGYRNNIRWRMNRNLPMAGIFHRNNPALKGGLNCLGPG